MALFAEFTDTFKKIFGRQKLSLSMRERAGFSAIAGSSTLSFDEPKNLGDRIPAELGGRPGCLRINCGRNELRYSARVPVHFSSDNEHSGFGYSTNLSPSGVLLETDTPLPTGVVLSLVILLRGAAPTLRCRGQVVWQQVINSFGASQEQTANPGQVEVGVQFLDLAAEQKKAIRDFIEQEGLRPRF